MASKNNPRYVEIERGEAKQYPGYSDAKPNLQSFLDAVNKSNPIVQSQYEMVWSRWPRTLFFAKNIDIPGVKTQTQEINHAGFTISIPTHPKYDSTEISFTIVADKEGYHYYDIRNMVLQTGHPLVAGDTRATIGSSFGVNGSEDNIEVRLRNSPEDVKFHHWTIHNFHPTSIGNVSLSQDGSGFVEFEVTGTFTHITYLSGDEKQSSGSSGGPGGGGSNGSGGSTVAGGNGGSGSQGPGAGDGAGAYGNGGSSNAAEANAGAQEGGWTGQTSEQGSGGSSQQDTPPKTTIDDQDEKDAFSIFKSVASLGKNVLDAGVGIVNAGMNAAAKTVDTATDVIQQVTKTVADTLTTKYPQEKPNVIQTRAEFAVDAARQYHETQQKRDNADEEYGDEEDENVKILVGAGSDGGFVPTTGDYDQMDVLLKAVRYNHEISGEKFKLKVNVKEELDLYENRIMNISLPRRFGMYKPQTSNISRSTQVEIEDILEDVEPSSYATIDPDHKIRRIFP